MAVSPNPRMPMGGNLVQLTARASISGDSTRGKMIPCAPLSSARATSAYSRSATRTKGVRPAIDAARHKSCKVSWPKQPCSASRNAQSKPAAANILATSGERNCANPQPSCRRPSFRAFFTELMRIRSPINVAHIAAGHGRQLWLWSAPRAVRSHRHDAMVGAIQFDGVVKTIYQVEPVLREERKNRVKALLQMALRKQGADEKAVLG